jgi:hypothetical protein
MIWKWVSLPPFFRCYTQPVNRDSADRLWWVPSKKCAFKVKTFNSLVGFEGRRFPWKSVWRTQDPSRAAFFSWLVALGKILTVDNLRKRNIIIVDRYCLCKRDGETMDHLLLRCDVASTLWIHVFTRFSMSSVMPKRVINLFACW